MKKKKFLKQLAAVSVCGALVLSVLAGCGSTASSTAASSEAAPSVEATEAALFTAGSYTATAAGRNGDVTVTAEFSANEIVSITVDSEETATIGGTAMDALIEEILANQSLGVDAVAGATLSSEAFLAALADCVQQAGGDVDALRQVQLTNTAAADSITVTEADVIVVGAGGAGLMAATTAANAGASVILLEKSNMVGGNTLCATMGINAVGSQVQADQGFNGSMEQFIENQLNNPDAREELVTALAEASGETVDWLAEQGVEFTVGGNNDYMLMATADGKTSTTIVNAVYKALQATDVNLYLNMDATTLVTDANGIVTGVVAVDSKGNEHTFSGKSVVLCTGGFGQNQELLAEVDPSLATAITDEIAPTTGEGLLMAQELGAETVDLDAIQLFPHVIVNYGLLTPNNLPGGFNPNAIYVNENAERFVKEGFEVSDAVLAQPNGMAYCIFNESDLNDTLKGLVDNGVIVSASSPAELAEKLGLDADALTATVEAWNAACEAGSDEFGRENLVPLEGTLYGYNFGVGAHYFMGGVLINENTQVVKTDGTTIDGLYAAGEVTGGFHGTYRIDGCGLADAIVFGRIAGQQAAADALK